MNASNNDMFWSQVLESFPQILGAAVALLAYALVAAQLLLTEIQLCVVVGGGAFLLGFIGSRWTMPFAEVYPRMLLQSGMQLGVDHIGCRLRQPARDSLDSSGANQRWFTGKLSCNRNVGTCVCHHSVEFYR